MQDMVIICKDTDEKKNHYTVYFFITLNVTLISYSFPLSVSLTLTNIIEVVKNK